MQIRWKMRAEIAKNKFSDIGLASSKGLFFERKIMEFCHYGKVGTLDYVHNRDNAKQQAMSEFLGQNVSFENINFMLNEARLFKTKMFYLNPKSQKV